ncbi:MAG: hypothetical protein LBK99_17820 [Opitutaceae bacterium]|jgi:hypothetical protein|nr:hypothetical protein [Opitutaceae bacterium]
MAIHQSKIYRALGGEPKLLEKFCTRMEAGDSGRALANWVEEHAFNARVLPLTDQNITDFRQGYFARWQERREAAQAIRDRAAAARQLVGEAVANGADLAQGAQTVASAMLTEALGTFDPATFTPLLKENPGMFLKVVQSINTLAAGERDASRLRQEAERLAADLRRLQMQAEKLAADLRLRDADLKLRDEQIASLRQERDLAKTKLRDQIADLRKEIERNTGTAESRLRMSQIILETIDAM